MIQLADDLKLLNPEWIVQCLIAGKQLKSEPKELLHEFQLLEQFMYGFRRKEAAGIPLLGSFLNHIVEILEKSKFMSAMEFTVMDTK